MNPSFIIDFSNITNIIDLVLACLLFVFVIFCCFKWKFSRFSSVSLIVSSALLIILWVFNLSIACRFLFLLMIALIFILCLTHTGPIRILFSKFSKRSDVAKKKNPNKIIDHDALYKEIYNCVSACSKQKIGVLITFEKHDNLKDLSKNGTVINAPVTAELLMTIFYPGTRLHDGAVIIKDDMIYAASVYYTPTTKALSGKYGSRHRAAIGISEISDSITVVVSEETGRISIAENGEIEPVFIDEFIAKLSEAIEKD